jgi:carbonic anhydrase/acetyltransferase-like protein (isoleucine patch superfamily)
MTTFAVVNNSDLLPAVNYLLSNLDTNTGGNIALPGNVLVANTTTGVISQSGNTTPVGYLYQYVNIRYSNNAIGTDGFSTSSNNFAYFGVYNSAGPTPSANPVAYQWFQVSPPFDSATSRTLYYSAIGGRQVQFAAASSPPSSSFVVTVANVAIDLDIVTTAAGTPGERGPIAMAYVITTADPTKPPATDAQLTTWFEASRSAVVPPIGTGLTPVVGDTAYFTYPTTGTSVTYEYNGSVWVVVVGQVVSGDTLVGNTVPGTALQANTITGDRIQSATITGNLIAGSTITGNLIAGSTITGNLIAASTITANNIATGTITATQIAANTITAGQIAANTITAGQIAANTITATNIATGTLTTNLFTANTINANIIQANTFTANTISGQAIIANTFSANTINGQAITSGSITTDKLAANVLTANTVISTGAFIGNFASPGFWLEGNSGNARFGNTLSVGNQLTVGNNAVIGGNLTIGATANIANNLRVGNNAIIGGNLSITGLVTSSILDANTVQTTTIVPAAVSAGVSSSSNTNQDTINPVQATRYFTNTTSVISVTTATQPVYVWAQVLSIFDITPSTNYVILVLAELVRTNSVGVDTTIFSQSFTGSQTFSQFSFQARPIWAGFIDTPGVGTFTYRMAVRWINAGGTFTVNILRFSERSMLTQTLKR